MSPTLYGFKMMQLNKKLKPGVVYLKTWFFVDMSRSLRRLDVAFFECWHHIEKNNLRLWCVELIKKIHTRFSLHSRVCINDADVCLFWGDHRRFSRNENSTKAFLSDGNETKKLCGFELTKFLMNAFHCSWIWN